MGVSTAAVTGLVDRLVKYAYIVRVFDPGDRRIIRIKLTAGGLSLVKKVNQQRRQMIISIFEKISEADRKDYLRILMQIKEILDQPGA
jgi:DNA-binding MarR family transcriptional regulator